MLTQEENELLCRVEDNAPMGQLMRRHWTPAPPPIDQDTNHKER